MARSPHLPDNSRFVPAETIDRLRAAFDRVKEFPEFKPDERVRWLELRAAVEQLLERHG